MTTKDFISLTEVMEPFDIVVYALQAYNESNYSYLAYDKVYNDSFTPASKTTTNLVRMPGMFENCASLSEIKINHFYRIKKIEFINFSFFLKIVAR
mgnify:CR=1 FL=1